MKISTKWMAITYFILGVLFTYFAIQNINNFGWNVLAYLYIFIATLDFGASYRYFKRRK